VAHATGIAPLITDLLENGHEFSFVQVMRLARKHIDPEGEEGLPEIPWQDRVRVRPELSLAFPASDVAAVERDGDNLRVTATFLALYGASSPLPAFYTEDLMDEASNDESVCRDFLDIIHQRLYHLWFQCWSKYRLLIRVVEENNPIDKQRLLCLIGLGEKELAGSVPDAFSLLRYTGILTQYPRSAMGLKTILRDALGMKSITIIQNILRLVPIPDDQRMRMLVSGRRLGMDTVLGSKIADRMGKIRIRVGPLAWREFNDLLPGTARNDKLTGLTRFYLADPLDVELELVLAAGEAQPIRIGDPEARLGLNTWDFAGSGIGEVSALFRLETLPTRKRLPSAPDTAPTKTAHTFMDYYCRERELLGEHLLHFVESHPNLAPLVNGPVADQGVEKLLEGTAFLNALLQQKLDDDIPEFIHEITRMLYPEQLRPVPASTIIAFTPKPNLTETQIIPAGTELTSVPVEGTQCRFTTCRPVEIHPLTLTSASLAQPPGKAAAITLSLKLAGITLSDWNVQKLRLFLAREYENASNLYLVLLRSVNRIVISPHQGSGRPITLEASHLKPVGLEDADLFFPDSSTVASHQSLREYFLQPDKLLFLDLMGLDTWRGRGEGTDFDIRFELEDLPFTLHKVSADDFTLFATPAVNLFKHQARPIPIDNRIADHPIYPEGSNAEHYQVYSVEKVCGLLRGLANPIVYNPEKLYTGKTGNNQSYRLTRCESSLHSGSGFNISVDTDKTRSPGAEILDIALLCTNGTLPNRLDAGEICMPTTNSPAYATFSNVKNIVPSARPTLGNNHLWKCFSLTGFNLHLLTLDSLRSLLATYLLSDCPDCQEERKQKNRLHGIAGLDVAARNRLVGRSILRGWEIRIKLQKKQFASDGDMYLFGALLDRFVALFATQTVFTQTVVEDVQGRREYRWPLRMGRRPLI
jgi:type VI secretion system protein ImpG